MKGILSEDLRSYNATPMGLPVTCSLGLIFHSVKMVAWEKQKNNVILHTDSCSYWRNRLEGSSEKI